MNLKAICTTILIVFSITFTNAQSKDILAKSAMLNADEAYAQGKYYDCYTYLISAVKTLGNTNSRIQYLLVKSLMAMGIEMKDDGIWKMAEKELKVFFEVTPENYVPEKYDEMVLAVSKVKKYIKDAEEECLRKIQESSIIIERDATNAEAYFDRVSCEYFLGDYDGVLKDLSKVMELGVIQNYIYETYAFLFVVEEHEVSNKDLQKILYYKLACLFSKIGDQRSANESLTWAFKKGYNDFSQIEINKDFDNIRNSPEFKELINTYKK